jgi:hypothetical protein
MADDSPYDAGVDRIKLQRKVVQKRKALKGLQDLYDLRQARKDGGSDKTSASAASKVARASLKLKAANAAAAQAGVLGAVGATTTVAPSVSANTSAGAGITLTSPLTVNPVEKDSITMEAYDDTFIETFKSPEAIPREGQIGALVFSKGIAYIRTRGGIVNLGEALEHADPIFFTKEQKMDKKNDRRAAIAAQKAKKETT